MPFYVYKCKKCEKSFEAEQKMTESPILKCNLCNEGDVFRVIFPSPVIFKGAGFYATDYGKSKK